ncbi:MAG: transcriptional activator RfaH [Gammaproteobacteria bacterium]|uniref:transcriptional activator RfaH n=1 Tax=Limnobacter sp. TaxID=2003368 RepID=UPI001DA5C8BE|nr:transcriptional activator RfaH [Limnobacter sp.]MBU0783583.1 transcriptional activator RfaH [Gammaproteobacteria bacterium]MBU0850316.1 transcriptional activator RfaH [Gammaproteobacteria bacterium]MBU1267079.1 transcriptional activator RfaH [Gammaproteobacteria bacterium]MBU1529121.1 transcriptional activator RfaH [Gammaproteobacteria bacterium]MBU1781653.1 transcriptional activator RfaH [Gammaproteobacteria bacterium]
MAKWYVMYTKPRQEHMALENLQRQNYTVFYPQARVLKRKAGKGSTAVVEPLFPRYMFVNLEVGVSDFSKLRSTKGCMDLVKFGGKPSTVPAELIELIQSQIDGECVIDLAKLPELEVGSGVRIAEGPFEGLMGTIASQKSDERVIVLLNILGAERSVELQRNQIDSV